MFHAGESADVRAGEARHGSDIPFQLVLVVPPCKLLLCYMRTIAPTSWLVVRIYMETSTEMCGKE